MRLGIFGDSFVDFNRQESLYYAWPSLLSKSPKLKKFIHIARSGTSNWYSYQNFLKNINDIDCLIFGYTSYTRWPHLPDEYLGWNYRVSNENIMGFENVPKVLNVMNTHFFEIFPDKLTKFISTQIFKDINEKCKEKNIYLINLNSFSKDNFELTETEFPILKGLNEISINEIVNINGKVKTMGTLINKNRVVDKRACHLNKKNNILLANYLSQILHERPKNLEVDLFKKLNWQNSDPHTDFLFNG